jgi:ComF family protein
LSAARRNAAKRLRSSPRTERPSLKALARSLVSLVVPPVCAACHEPDLSGAGLCGECRSRLHPLRDPRCKRCGAPLAVEVPCCSECRRRALAFDRAWAAFAYEGVARQAVAALKSRGALAAALPMAAQLAARAPRELLAGALVPVPAHAERRRRHGFNQAEALARALGKVSGLPVRCELERDRSVGPQTGLERSARLRSATASVRASRSVPERAVLVDDVYTTGATLDACAHALRARGARAVVAVTFARTLRVAPGPLSPWQGL